MSLGRSWPGRLHRVVRRPEVSLPLYEALVLIMGSNPKPYDLLAFKHAEGSDVSGDTNRIERLGGIDALESETGVSRVPLEECVCFDRTAAEICGEPPKGSPKAPRGARLHS